MIREEDDMDTGGATTDTPNPIIPPPPGFQQFSWPREDWQVGGDWSLFNFAKELPGWFPWSFGGLPVDLPPLPVSPIIPDSLDDSVTANMGSSREESNTPSEVVVVAPSTGDVIPDVMDAAALADSPLPTEGGQLADSPLNLIATGLRGDRRFPGRVPRWRLAREGPFLAERSSTALRSFGAGCVFQNTTYRTSDYASPSREFGVPLNHPRFLEWIGVPESASLLEMGPGEWFNTLLRDKAMDAAIQLHQNVA